MEKKLNNLKNFQNICNFIVQFKNVDKRHCKKSLTINFDVVGVDHGYNLVEGNMYLLAPSIHAQSNGSSLGDAAEVVGFLLSVLGVPAHVVLVGQDSCGHGGAVVSS